MILHGNITYHLNTYLCNCHLGPLTCKKMEIPVQKFIAERRDCDLTSCLRGNVLYRVLENVDSSGDKFDLV
jgi:hypothetical protein